jgi:Trk K+ transport system NAD-binding subunit
VPAPLGELADHVVLCGANALTSRIAEELTARYGLAVAAIVPDAGSEYALRLAATPSVHVLERPELTADAFADAGMPAARGLAILHQDDLGNFHAALRAQDLSPRLRQVIAIFNSGLGERIRSFFADCAVLSEADMSAPSLVAAALGEPAPSHVTMAGRTMYVARRQDVGAGQVICGLAASSDADAPSVLPPADPAAGLVLAVADGTPRNPLSRQRRRRRTAPARLLRRVVTTKLGLVCVALFGVLVAGFVLLAGLQKYSVLTSLYLTTLDAAGAAQTGTGVKHYEKIAQFLLTFDGMAIVPLITAAVVGARIARGAGTPKAPEGDHVIVAGLGAVGTRIMGQLQALGIEVVGVDKSATATGIPLAESLGIHVVIGETHREETLRAAGITTCQALVSVTDSDIANLETALNARALATRPRIVLRLYDDDLAARVQATIGNAISRSTSYLAAPAFAAAVLDHQVLHTIAVGRHVLLVAEVAADDGSLAGRTLATVHQPGLLRVIALRLDGGDSVDWSPDPGYVIRTGDRVLVLATRAGLSGLLRPDSSAPATTSAVSTSGK